MILTPLQKSHYNVGNLGIIFVATSFKWLPKVQKIAQSGHTVHEAKMSEGQKIGLRDQNDPGAESIKFFCVKFS